MGVETPIPPQMINAAAPGGAPPQRIKTVEIIICGFSWFGCELPFMCVSPQHFLQEHFFNNMLLAISGIF